VVDPKTSDIAHRGRSICNPISSPTLDQVVERAQLPAGGSALDVGSGKGELLLRLAARYPVTALGLDINPARVDEAKSQARKRHLEGRVRFLCEDGGPFVPPERDFALAACVGSTHALGGLAPALRSLHSWTRPGGWVVVGEGFWMREPDPEYLAALGATRDELGEGGWVEEAARGIGLEVVEAWTSTREAWDAYEGALLRGVERYVEEALADRDGPKMLEEQRAFHAAQMRWGRETMGFAVHLFRRPGHPPQ